MKMKILLISFIVIFCNCSKDKATIKYLVTGTATLADITYNEIIDENMDKIIIIELLNESIPYEYEYKIINIGSEDDKCTVELCATLIENNTNLILQIYVDGRLKKTDTITNLNEKKCIQETIELDGVWD